MKFSEVKQDITDSMNQILTKSIIYYAMNKLPGFPYAQTANLFVMYAKAR
jgi:hypothetical protein